MSNKRVAVVFFVLAIFLAGCGEPDPAPPIVRSGEGCWLISTSDGDSWVTCKPIRSHTFTSMVCFDERDIERNIDKTVVCLSLSTRFKVERVSPRNGVSDE